MRDADKSRIRDFANWAIETAEERDQLLLEVTKLMIKVDALEQERDQANTTASDAKLQNERLVERVKVLERELKSSNDFCDMLISQKTTRGGCF